MNRSQRNLQELKNLRQRTRLSLKVGVLVLFYQVGEKSFPFLCCFVGQTELLARNFVKSLLNLFKDEVREVKTELECAAGF